MKGLGVFFILALMTSSLAARTKRQTQSQPELYDPEAPILPDEPSQVDPPILPDTPVQPDVPSQPVDPVQPDVPEQPTEEEPECTVPTAPDCESADLIGTVMGYLSDTCDVKRFYQCVKDDLGGWVIEHLTCGPCTVWDQTQITCVWQAEECTDDSATPPEPIETEADAQGIFFCKRGSFWAKPNLPGTGYRQYVHHHNTWLARACPHGTRFTIALCGCTHCSCNYPDNPSRTSCLNFESGWDNLGTSDGTYVGLVPAGGPAPVSSPGADGTAQAGKFDGATNLRSWRYGGVEWKAFEVSFWYKQRIGGIRQGLICNGNRANPSTFVISSTGLLFKSLSVKVGFALRSDWPTKYVEIVVPNCIDLSWHKVDVKYDGRKLSVALDGSPAGEAAAKGTVFFPSPPLVIGAMARRDENNHYNYFVGQLDEICITYSP